MPTLKAKLAETWFYAMRELVKGRHFRKYAPQSPPAEPGSVLRIALVSLIPSLGDNVMLYPLLDAIRKEHPNADISVFSAGGGAILALHSAVNHFHLVPIRAGGKFTAEVGYIYRLWTEWRKSYRHLRFDVCFVPRGGVDPFHSAHLAWMLGGRIRAGYSRELEPERKEYDLDEDQLFTVLVRQAAGIHEVERGAEVLRAAGVLSRTINLEEPVQGLIHVGNSAAGQEFLSRWHELCAPYAIVAPGASFARRRWSPAGFAELAQAMTSAGMISVFVGSTAERTLCEQIVAEVNGPTVIITSPTFPELVALMSRAEYFVGNDSGPGHVAGAVGVPTVEATAFAESSDPRHHAAPDRSHPCGPLVTVLQPAVQLAPCTTECVAQVEHCITQIKPAEMQTAVTALLLQRREAAHM
jgi:ADP-heptose:LPS heptosyltransferase